MAMTIVYEGFLNKEAYPRVSQVVFSPVGFYRAHKCLVWCDRVVVWKGMAPQAHTFEYSITREWHC